MINWNVSRYRDFFLHFKNVVDKNFLDMYNKVALLEKVCKKSKPKRKNQTMYINIKNVVAIFNAFLPYQKIIFRYKDACNI